MSKKRYPCSLIRNFDFVYEFYVISIAHFDMNW